jgi:hypothetical protein
VNAGGLDLPVNALLVGWQEIKVPLRGGGQGLDDILQGIAVQPVPQVEEEDRHLGVREELREKVALAQVLAHRKIVGEVAVMHQGHVQRREGVGPAGVPDPPPGGIALVRDPDVGLEIQELVV